LLSSNHRGRTTAGRATAGIFGRRVSSVEDDGSEVLWTAYTTLPTYAFGESENPLGNSSGG
jgi:hypothetical protein